MTENTSSPVLDAAEFARFAKAVWSGRAENTRIFVGALPTKANKEIADKARDEKKPMSSLPIECRTHWRAYGPSDADNLLKFMQGETGRRNLYVKLARYTNDASSPNISNVAAAHCSWLDIDVRAPEEKRVAADILWALGPMRPSIIVSSGGGIHAYWLYTQPLQGEDLDTVREINEHLSRMFCGDSSVTHVAGSLRVPGSWNINRNAPCKIVHMDEDPARFDPAKLLKWVTKEGPHLMRNEAGLSEVPESARAALRAHEIEAENAHNANVRNWDDIAAALSIEGASNPYGGRNRALTMWAGKVYSMGGSVEDAVNTAVKHGCSLTEAEIKSVCESVARTHERMNDGKPVPKTRADKEDLPPITDTMVGVDTEIKTATTVAAAAHLPEVQPDEQPGPNGTDAGSSPAGEATPEAEDHTFDPTDSTSRLAALIRRGNDSEDDFTFTISQQLRPITDAFLDWLSKHGLILLYEIGKGGDGWWWCYSSRFGVWRLRTTEEVEGAVTKFWHDLTGEMPKSADRKEIVNALRLDVQQPTDAIQWDNYNGQHLVVSADHKVIDVITGKLLKPSPDYYLTDRSRVAADYDPAAKSPVWDAAVRLMFDANPEKDGIASMIEEWMGSSLLGPVRPRDTFKGLLITGESLGGKSSIGYAARAVLGDSHVVAADLETIQGSFGLSTFFERRASMWICDDPQSNTKLPDGIVKKIITNESVTINIKNKSMRDGRLGLTVGIFCNEMPKIDDTSNAVYNRMLLLKSEIIFELNPDSNDPRQRKADPDLSIKFEAEKSGIFNRMIEGARRLISRGTFTQPNSVLSTREEVHDQQAPARAFLKQCLVAKPTDTSRVQRKHLRAAFVGFMESENPGWARSSKTQYEMRRFYKAFASLHPKSEKKREGRIRAARSAQEFQTHVNFNEDGLAYLALGMAVEGGNPDQNYSGDPEVKFANDLRYLGMDAQGKPKLEAVSGGKSETKTAGE